MHSHLAKLTRRLDVLERICDTYLDNAGDSAGEQRFSLVLGFEMRRRSHREVLVSLVALNHVTVQGRPLYLNRSGTVHQSYVSYLAVAGNVVDAMSTFSGVSL